MRKCVFSILATFALAAPAPAPSEPIDLPTCEASFNSSLGKPNSYLPDPFKFQTGVSTTQWTETLWGCRRKEVSNLFQQYELGSLPGPPSQFSATFDNGSNNMTISCGENGTSITFVVPFTYPSSGVPKSGYPAMITYGPPSIPIPDGVVTIQFDNSAFAVQNNASNRGMGTYYDLFGKDKDTGALMAWTWGVGRILDALQNTTNTGVDPSRVGITGCSRNGKGALVAGAFEERLVLTIPQESGSGGTTCWRLSDGEQADGNVVQTLAEIVTENVWYSEELASFVNHTDLLPFDHHQLIGLVAPRGLLVIDNSAYAWLSPQSAWGCAVEVGDHLHCQFPSDQQADLSEFFNKFLFQNGTIETQVNETSVGVFNWTQWVDWSVPTVWAEPS